MEDSKPSDQPKDSTSPGTQNSRGDSSWSSMKVKPVEANHPKLKLLSVSLLLIATLCLGFFGGWLGGAQQANDQLTPQKEQVILQSQGDLISDIAEEVGQSVVSITARGQQTSNFFGFSDQPPWDGTGIILTDDGLIMTNRHVVPQETTEVNVTLSDGTEYENVEIVGRTGSSDSLDVAFLKIADTKSKKLVPAKIGDSAKMEVGDPVVAIGNALGQFENTVTSGIISGYGRSVAVANSDGSEAANLENVFQTDAAINAGNSGGPLVNLNGEIIGLNTAAALEDAQNIGFAIPINDVAGLIKSVKEKGVLERPFLGVIYIPLTNDAAEAYGLNVNRGAYIAPPAIIGSNPIIPDGPADKADVQVGDIITKIDGEAIDQQSSLSSLINKHAVGDKVELTVLRDGKEQTIEVTLAAAPSN